MSQSTSHRPRTSAHIAIAGAGVIGLSCAFELISRGHSVTLFDPAEPSNSTSWAAAGMIAPAYELMLQGEQEDEALSELCFESAALWQDFARRVQAVSGVPVGYNRAPTLALATSPTSVERLERLKERLSASGHALSLLKPSRLTAEFGLSDKVRLALCLPDDHQVDNRRLLGALREAVTGAGGRFVQAAVDSESDIEAACPETGFDAIVWARGVKEFGVTGRVKGQALALQPVAGAPRQVLRYGSGYIVPKPDRIVIGATSEADFSSEGVTPAITDGLLADALDICPALVGAPVMERWAGFRPKGPTERPVIGAYTSYEFIASAHYRNGVLLAPVTAKLIADQVEGLSLQAEWTSFAPSNGLSASA